MLRLVFQGVQKPLGATLDREWDSNAKSSLAKSIYAMISNEDFQALVRQRRENDPRIHRGLPAARAYVYMDQRRGL